MNNYNPPCGGSFARRGNGMTGSCNAHMSVNDTDCACKKAPFPVNTALAMAYVPFQQSGEVYSCERALSRGTAFPCLDKPFLMGCCR